MILGDLSNSLADGDKEEDLTLLMTCCVEAVTVYYVVNDPSHCCQLLERTSEISRAMARRSAEQDRFVADFDDLVCDCLRQFSRQLGTESFLALLEPMELSTLTYVVNITRRSHPDLLDGWISSARNSKSCQSLLRVYQAN